MKRNKFSLSNYHSFTCNMGYLVPYNWFEVLPGDTVQMSTQALIRIQPLLAPLMHTIRVRIHHWYVPLRLIWDDFEDFITGGEDGTSTPTHPYIQVGNASTYESTLYDYLGIPPEDYSGDPLNVSALPFRALIAIYNDHYRDQDLISEETLDKTSGQDTTTTDTLLKCAWEKDYFTSCRSQPMKGDTVTIPLGDRAPLTHDVVGAGVLGVYSSDYAAYKEMDASGAALQGSGTGSTEAASLYADLSAATGIDIADFRLAIAVQRFQEAMQRHGSRYGEYLKHRFGVRSSDARLQNPEYLGGGRQTLMISEVLSTDSGGSDPVGAMKGHGISALRTNRFRRFFEEHGIVMSVMSVVPKAVYTTALQRGFLRTVKEDYFQKELQFIGEQEITNREVQTNNTSPDDVFGYQMRYDDYRFQHSRVSGEFRSTLDHWHMGRQHSGDVALNQSYVECTPTTRILAAPSTDALYVMTNNSIQARRIMSKYSTPRTM